MLRVSIFTKYGLQVLVSIHPNSSRLIWWAHLNVDSSAPPPVRSLPAWYTDCRIAGGMNAYSWRWHCSIRAAGCLLSFYSPTDSQTSLLASPSNCPSTYRRYRYGSTFVSWLVGAEIYASKDGASIYAALQLSLTFSSLFVPYLTTGSLGI